MTNAIKFATTIDHQPTPTGHAWVLLQANKKRETVLTVADMIAEKVRCEMRKARAGGMGASSIQVLTGNDAVDFGPVAEAEMIAVAQGRVTEGAITITVDGAMVEGLDTVVTLRKASTVVFDVTTLVAA